MARLYHCVYDHPVHNQLTKTVLYLVSVDTLNAIQFLHPYKGERPRTTINLHIKVIRFRERPKKFAYKSKKMRQLGSSGNPQVLFSSFKIFFVGDKSGKYGGCGEVSCPN
jgi:hypothetical protein